MVQIVRVAGSRSMRAEIDAGGYARCAAVVHVSSPDVARARASRLLTAIKTRADGCVSNASAASLTAAASDRAG